MAIILQAKYQILTGAGTYSKVEDESSENRDFELFWSELQSWLRSKRTITNWTIDKGELGEDFETGPVIGKHVPVYPQSTRTDLKVPKKDFNLIFANLTAYIKGIIRRGELAKHSRFTKYTISIIHQYLSDMQKAS